jgi:hypothetical protein
MQFFRFSAIEVMVVYYELSAIVSKAMGFLLLDQVAEQFLRGTLLSLVQ